MLATLLLALAPVTPAPALPAEALVTATVEELRKGELMLDADAIGDLTAASFSQIDGGTRISGSFAFLEPMRRLRERGGTVTNLRFEQLAIKVFGASAIASYRYSKDWTLLGVRHHEEGWSSDVFELRSDGAWTLVHRHRAR
jgi:hypothetical protein